MGLAVTTTILSTPAPSGALTGETALLTLSRTTIDAGSNETVTATVTAKTAGQPQYNVQAAFSSSGDIRISNNGCSTQTNGECSVTLYPGTTYGSQTITANVTGIEWSASATATIMQYGAPTSLTLTVSPNSLQADDATSSTATATVTDSQGRGVAGEPVALSVTGSGPAPAPPTDNGNGTYTTLIVSPPPDPTQGSNPYSEVATASIPSPALSASQTITLTNPTPKLVGPLTATIGTPGSPGKVYDANHNPIVLRGLNTGSGKWVMTPASREFPDAAAVGSMYRWGANYIRIILTSDQFLPGCPETSEDTQYAEELTQFVNLVTSYGMLAMLDYHGTDPGCAYGTPERVPLPDSASAIPFLEDLSQEWNGGCDSQHISACPAVSGCTQSNTSACPRPGSGALVAFELYNEPEVCASGLDGGTDAGPPPGTPNQDSVTLQSTFGSNSCTVQTMQQGWLWGGKSATQTYGSTTASWVPAGTVCLYSAVRGLADNLNCDPTGTGNGTLAADTAAASSNLVFIDSGGWAGDPNSWNYWNEFPAAAQQDPNIVWVMHYYDCQYSSTNSNATQCNDTSPETCPTISSALNRELTIANDQHLQNLGLGSDVGKSQPRPVVFDEFGWTLAGSSWQGPVTVDGQSVQYNFNADNQGEFVNNVLWYLTSQGAGYAEFYWGGSFLGDSPQQGGYEIVKSATSVPFVPNVDGSPLEAGMQNPSSLQCETPPVGDDVPTTPAT